LFYCQDGRNLLATMAEIKNILWDGMVESSCCQYCGHNYEGMECPGCAARRREKVVTTGVATFDLFGYCHPDNAWIMALPRRIEIHYIECGRVDDYDNWEMRIIFEGCEAIMKRVDDPSSMGPPERAVMFFVRGKGNVLIEYRNTKGKEVE
jgi:hypothetical protein